MLVRSPRDEARAVRRLEKFPRLRAAAVCTHHNSITYDNQTFDSNLRMRCPRRVSAISRLSYCYPICGGQLQLQNAVKLPTMRWLPPFVGLQLVDVVLFVLRRTFLQ